MDDLKERLRAWPCRNDVAAELIEQSLARIEALEAEVKEALHRIDREANGIRKDKAARVSAIARATLAKLQEPSHDDQ